MKINITEQQILDLFLENKIFLENIEDSDKKIFITNNAYKLLQDGFINKNFNQLENLFSMKEVEDIFFNEIEKFKKLSQLNFIEKMPENNLITYFIGEMTRQNFSDKESFFKVINELVIKNKECMKDFFTIRLGEGNSGFPKHHPIGLVYLRMLDEVEQLFEEEIISIDLFSLKTKDTIVHFMSQYSFQANKTIIERTTDLNKALKDKNELGQNPVEKLSMDLRYKNIDTLEYLFIEKLDLKIFSKELLNYIVKCSNILKNKNTKESLRERVFQSLELVFNNEKLQIDSELKEDIAKNLGIKVIKEVHYLWLNAKLKLKGIDHKKKKI